MLGQLVELHLFSPICLHVLYRDNFTFNFNGVCEEMSLGENLVFIYLHQYGQNCNINIAQNCGEGEERKSETNWMHSQRNSE